MGYTPLLSTSVWMGYSDSNTRSLYNIKGVSKVYGGTIPASTWKAFMGEAMKGKPPADFPEPTPLAGDVSAGPRRAPLQLAPQEEAAEQFLTVGPPVTLYPQTPLVPNQGGPQFTIPLLPNLTLPQVTTPTTRPASVPRSRAEAPQRRAVVVGDADAEGVPELQDSTWSQALRIGMAMKILSVPTPPGLYSRDAIPSTSPLSLTTGPP